jgi:hypothetical protein
MRYTGGFSLHGRKIGSSTSVSGDMATIEVMGGEVEKKFKARSKEFVFQDSAVSGQPGILCDLSTE